jgi:rRNA maturation endonuclease Nob1
MDADSLEPTGDEILARISKAFVLDEEPKDAAPADAAPATQAPEGEAPETEAEGSEEAPEAEPTIETLEDLAKTYGLEADAFAAEIKVAGPNGATVPLAEVLRNYRESASNEQLFDQVKARATEFETKERTRAAEHEKTVGELRGLTGKLIEQVKAGDQIDWKKLEEEDPARFAAERTKHTERLLMADAAVRNLEAEQARQQQEGEAAKARWVQEQRAKLFEKNADWREPAKFQAAVTEVAGYLSTAGFDPNETGVMDLVQDHRVMRTIWEAAQYRALQAKTTSAIKKVETLPKVIRGGARADDAAPKEKRLAELRARQRKRGDAASTVALLREMEN